MAERQPRVLIGTNGIDPLEWLGRRTFQITHRSIKHLYKPISESRAIASDEGTAFTSIEQQRDASRVSCTAVDYWLLLPFEMNVPERCANVIGVMIWMF